MNTAAPLQIQVGGDHYKTMPIQPVEYIHKNNIPFIEGNVIKYVSRWRNKAGVEDLKKARHFLDLLINLESMEGPIDLPALRAIVTGVPRIGELWPEEGGIYVGVMRGEEGKPDYHLIAPVDAHTTDIACGGEGKDEPDAQSHWDGRANTAALCASKHKHPAAKWAAGLQIDGHNDLYLPALRELRLCWANVPELFESAWYWTSTQCSSYSAWIQDFFNGSQNYGGKGYKSRARAVRRREI